MKKLKSRRLKISATGTFSIALTSPRLSLSRFTEGEIYLFNRNDPTCPAEGSLWGVFDKRIGDTIYLESSSLNLQNFRKWHLLPIAYRFCRLATRSELRDYTANLIWSEKSCFLSKPRLAYEQA